MSIIRHEEQFRDKIVLFIFAMLLRLQPANTFGPSFRAKYDKMIARTPHAKGVKYEEGVVGGVHGWWCKPPEEDASAGILYLHGGAYVLGSAAAYRHYAGQIASRAQASAFIADYRLAPEHPYPEALVDAYAAYQGLVALGMQRIVLAGDSAGAGLALALLERIHDDDTLPNPAGVMLASPWTDLALTGKSISSRAEQDLLLKKSMLDGAASMYLGAVGDRHIKGASPLYGSMPTGTPLLIHVGEHEILLDDSLRYAENFEASGGSIRVHVWQGMPHVFCGLVGMLKAAPEALNIGGDFIRDALAVTN